VPLAKPGSVPQVYLGCWTERWWWSYWSPAHLPAIGAADDNEGPLALADPHTTAD